MLRVIREVRPRYIVGENVSGLVNWSDGLVFEEVQVNLENEGYEVQAFVLPACAVDAPHRRDRVWFIANRNSTSTKHPIQTGGNLFASKSGSWTTSNADCNGQQWGNSKHEINAGQRGEYAQRDVEQSVKYGTTSNADSKRYEKCNASKISINERWRDDKICNEFNASNSNNQDANGIEHSPSQKNKSHLAADIGTMFQETHGKTSQLNPRFVLEMMGFPPDWTELPFQNGETKVSKQPETP
jgi:site-specific DNA-cytosine methylase